MASRRPFSAITLALSFLIAAQLRANTDPEVVANEFGQILGQLRQVFYQRYADMLGLNEITRPVVVLVFENLEEYLKIAAAKPALGLFWFPGLGGYFNPATGVLCMWSQENLWEVMFHEGTRQLMFHAAHRHEVEFFAHAPWLQEGFAEFFGGHRMKRLTPVDGESRFEFTQGEFLEQRYGSLAAGLRGGYAMSVYDLVHLGGIEFMEAKRNSMADLEARRQVAMIYAQGWALTMFLHRDTGGVYEPQFREILLAEAKGQLSGERFGEILLLETEEDWADFDSDFREWCLNDLRALKRR